MPEKIPLPGLHIGTLEKVSVPDLADAFQASFAGYFVPVSMTAEQLAARLRVDGVDLSRSAGAFLNGRLVGFILHAFRKRGTGLEAWNAGTGVLPDYRGRGLTAAMYALLLPRLRGAGVQRILLEVIDRNLPARQVYAQTGFRETGILGCYRTVRPAPERAVPEKISVAVSPARPVPFPEEQEPAWQNSDEVIGREPGVVWQVARLNGQMVGKAAHQPASGRVFRIAVDPEYRRQGIATALFATMRQASERPLHLINAWKQNIGNDALLQAQGLECYLTQYAMELRL